MWSNHHNGIFIKADKVKQCSLIIIIYSIGQTPSVSTYHDVFWTVKGGKVKLHPLIVVLFSWENVWWCVLVCKALMFFVDDDWMMMGDWTIWRISWIYIPNTSRMFCLTKSIIKFFALSMIHQSVRVVFFSPNFVKWIHFTFNVNVSGKTSSFYGFSGGCLFHQSGNTTLTNKSCSHYSNVILMIARV